MTIKYLICSGGYWNLEALHFSVFDRENRVSLKFRSEFGNGNIVVRKHCTKKYAKSLLKKDFRYFPTIPHFASPYLLDELM